MSPLSEGRCKTTPNYSGPTVAKVLWRCRRHHFRLRTIPRPIFGRFNPKLFVTMRRRRRRHHCTSAGTLWTPTPLRRLWACRMLRGEGKRGSSRLLFVVLVPLGAQCVTIAPVWEVECRVVPKAKIITYTLNQRVHTFEIWAITSIITQNKKGLSKKILLRWPIGSKR